MNKYRFDYSTIYQTIRAWAEIIASGAVLSPLIYLPRIPG